MINHVRTLVANIPYASPPLYLGEEVVPRSFAPRKLGEMADAYTLFFGASPQREFINFRLWQMLRIGHAMRDASVLLLQDDRITYLPWRTTYTDPALQSPQVTRLSGSNDITLFGTPTADTRRGRLRYSWQISVTASDKITVTDLLDDVEVVRTVNGNAGLSDLVPLGSGDLAFRTAYPLTVGDKWQVDVVAIPEPDIAPLVRQFDAQVRSPSFPLWRTAFVQTYRLRELYDARHGLLDRFTVSLAAWAAYMEEQELA